MHQLDLVTYPERSANLRLQSTFKNYLRRFKLESIWQYVLDNNSGAINTYHNNHHMMAVAVRSLELLHMEVSADKYEFDNQEEILFVAGMLHDMNHSGGVEDDDVNIERALSALDKIAGSLDAQFYDGFAHHVERVIQVTQFPFVLEPEHLDEKIIRDVDMLYSLEVEGVRIIMEGLRSEMVHKFGHLPTRETWLDMRFKFIEGVEIFTDSAKLIWEDGIERSNKAMSAYVKLMHNAME